MNTTPAPAPTNTPPLTEERALQDAIRVLHGLATSDREDWCVRVRAADILIRRLYSPLRKPLSPPQHISPPESPPPAALPRTLSQRPAPASRAPDPHHADPQPRAGAADPAPPAHAKIAPSTRRLSLTNATAHLADQPPPPPGFT